MVDSPRMCCQKGLEKAYRGLKNPSAELRSAEGFIVLNGTAARSWTALGAVQLLAAVPFMCYDPTENKRLYSGTCEVCGRLFASTKKKTRGHSDCMNRRRVMRSRAKQYAIRVEGGISPEDAARSSSISIAAARVMLEGDQYKFREGFDYWGLSLPDKELENRRSVQESTLLVSTK